MFEYPVSSRSGLFGIARGESEQHRVKNRKRQLSVLLSGTCSMPEARRGHREFFFFFIIRNSRVVYPNNLKFWNKLFINISATFLLVVPQKLFVGKVRKKYELRCAFLYYNIFINNRLFELFEGSSWLKWYFFTCPKNFETFHTFCVEKRRVGCKKKDFFSMKDFCIFIFLLGKVMNG